MTELVVEEKHAVPDGARIWPSEIRYESAERKLYLTFEDGAAFALTAERLRVESPSAEVQGHGGKKVIVTGKAGVGISAIEPVGNYAIRITFDDGHKTGLYTWGYLYGFGAVGDRNV